MCTWFYMWWQCACVYMIFIYPGQHYCTFPTWQLLSFFGSRKFLLLHLILKNCTYTKCIGCMHLIQRITNQYLCLTELNWVSLLLHVVSLESRTWLHLAENPSGKNLWKSITFMSIRAEICSSDDTESACNAEDLGLILGSGRSPGEGNGNPLQNSCPENSHGVTKSWTWLSK